MTRIISLYKYRLPGYHLGCIEHYFSYEICYLRELSLECRPGETYRAHSGCRYLFEMGRQIDSRLIREVVSACVTTGGDFVAWLDDILVSGSMDAKTRSGIYRHIAGFNRRFALEFRDASYGVRD